MNDSILVCTPVSLPDYRVIEAADFAGRLNPLNRPQFAASRDEPPSPARLAAMTGKFWPSPSRLVWCFLDGADPETRRLMADCYARWARYVNLDFAETSNPSQAHFRWTRGPSGHWSGIGTDCGLFPLNRPTGNLQGFTARTPLAEWRRIAEHEIGHGLAFHHTQLFPEVVGRIDPEAAYRYFGGPPNNWPRVVTQANVLTPFRPGDIALSNVQLTSVMMYGLPQSIMKPGFPAIPGGSGITEQDGLTAARVYPGRMAVPPPPPPGDPPSVRPGIQVRGRIDWPGDVDRYDLPVSESGQYTLDADPPMDLVVRRRDQFLGSVARSDAGPVSVSLDAGLYRVQVSHPLRRGTGPYVLFGRRVG